MVLPTGITLHPDRHCFYLVTEHSTYVFGITPDTGLILNLYWGPRLSSLDDIGPAQLVQERSSQDPSLTTAPEEYPVFGGLRYGQDCLKVELEHIRELDLVYTNHHMNDTKLTLVLSDRSFDGMTLELCYTIDPDTDIIERYARINNTDSRRTIHIEKILSAAFHLPAIHTPRSLVTLNGAWSAETQVHTLEPTSGSFTIGSTRGIPSAQAYPYFALTSLDNNNNQDTYFGSVAWSGNWIITVDVDYQGQVRIVGGLHSHDFGWVLEPGESFTTPVFMVGYSNQGTRWQLPRHINHHSKINPVLYNSWEAAGFDVSMQQQVELANQAKSLGVELFVLDDGWFKGRTSDRAGLGDWVHDRDKFPHGLKPLADHVHSLGMKFGLWFEPEMLNPDSDLYRQHPDWVYSLRNRQSSLARNQLVLNLTKPKVASFIYEQLHRNITNIGIDYIKWDMNRPISEAEYSSIGRDTREVWIRHVNVFYSLLERLKTDFPYLLIESCCSGGGRADPGVLKLVDQCWTSDNTQPDARLIIQHGISFILPPKMMSCWVTDMPQDDSASKSIPLAYRFHVSYMGALGIGSNIMKYDTTQLAESAYWIDLYKQLRHILQLGDLDWIYADHPRLAVTMTTTRDRKEAVVLGFRPSSPFWLPLPLIRLRHLDPEAKYQLKIWTTVIDSDDGGWTTYTGAHLLYKGLALPYLTFGAYKSVVVWIKKADL
ncbi:Melibiase-domain-containing protein [Chlamydoabsidia padenii]|nr:Melibiase-domain-containing protein [Chlamydoabsidia padenii]